MLNVLALPPALTVRILALDTRRFDKWRPYLELLFQGLVIVALWLMLTDPAFAAKDDDVKTTATGTDPWASSLTGLAGMLNGTVAKGIGTIALFAAGGMLVFGGELNEFTKKICMVVLALAVMVLGSTMIKTLFP